jgi:hypothetical protein
VFGVALLAFLLGWVVALVCAAALALGPPPPPKPETGALPRYREALRECEERLVAARISVVNAPEKGEGYLAVARAEKHCRQLLGLIAEEERTPRSAAPDPSLVRIVEAARAARRLGLPRREHLEACYLLAFAERERGNHRAEAAAWEDAVHLEPESARLWILLSDAYGRARRFRRAEGAREQALALVARRQ